MGTSGWMTPSYGFRGRSGTDSEDIELMTPSLCWAAPIADARAAPVLYDRRLKLPHEFGLPDVALRGGVYAETAAAGASSKGTATTEGALIWRVSPEARELDSKSERSWRLRAR